jgi:hypothetical protein
MRVTNPLNVWTYNRNRRRDTINVATALTKITTLEVAIG